jgi:hypothetical protein
MAYSADLGNGTPDEVIRFPHGTRFIHRGISRSARVPGCVKGLLRADEGV